MKTATKFFKIDLKELALSLRKSIDDNDNEKVNMYYKKIKKYVNQANTSKVELDENIILSIRLDLHEWQGDFLL